MLNSNYFHIIFSSVVIYLFMIIAIRLFGKKELSQLSIVDLVLILLISNAVQNAMVGQDTSLTGGLIAATALFLTNFLLKFIFYRFPRLERFVQGEALLLIYKGKLNEANIQKAKITLDEIRESIREHGVASIEEVDLAVMEMDGNISILSHEFQKRTIRKRKTRHSLFNQIQN